VIYFSLGSWGLLQDASFGSYTRPCPFAINLFRFFITIIIYYSFLLILVGPIRIGLTFTRSSSDRPSRQLGFFNLMMVLLLLLSSLRWYDDILLLLAIEKMTLVV